MNEIACLSQEACLEAARQVFMVEAQAVKQLAARLDESFFRAIQAILESSGRVIICGMGKSGIVGRKISATLASTGTRSFFMHPGEAYHGDLGMVGCEDVFIAISNSGATDEVIKLIPFLRANGNHLIAMTGNAESSLAKAAHVHLDVSVAEEACPFQLAPTSSTTATLAMGDALAVVLMKARKFQPEHFARFHPGGSLGRRLLGKVEDEMVTKNLPLVTEEAQVLDVIRAMTDSRLGLALVKRKAGGWGIITDGDIRRAVESFGTTLFEKCAKSFMSIDPATVSLGTRIEDALILMSDRQITSVLVMDRGQLVGVFKK